MKFESLMLKSLFAACLLVCAMTLGAMVTTHADVTLAKAQGTQAARRA
ncbi:hypothetical protein [Dyella sp.]